MSTNISSTTKKENIPSPPNENLNLLVQIKFFNLFHINISK